MPSIQGIISAFAKSSAGKYLMDPKNEKFVNSTLPVAQQALSELTGVAITVFNPKIEPEQKRTQIISHAMKAGINLTLVGAVAKSTAEFADKVAKQLEAPDSVKSGVKVGFPLLVSVLLTRLAIPVILNPLSTKIREKIDNKYGEKIKKLDIVA